MNPNRIILIAALTPVLALTAGAQTPATSACTSRRQQHPLSTRHAGAYAVWGDRQLIAAT